MGTKVVRRHDIVGYANGCRCRVCTEAKRRYEIRRRLDVMRGITYTVPALGSQRRVRALIRFGWPARSIAEHAGWRHANAVHEVLKRERVQVATADRLTAVFERLCMIPGPSETSRRRGEAAGWPLPLEWDDPDDPDEQPARVIVPHQQAELDQVVVERILAGDVVPSNRAERVEITRRWQQSGRSLNELERLTGWRCDRYTERQMQEAS
jgi:hypothetical protein